MMEAEQLETERADPEVRAAGGASDRVLAGAGIAVIAFAAIVAGIRPSAYPVFVDVCYHMAAVEGFDQAGGIPTWASWEMAPAGRPHIYPPALHAAGLLLARIGVEPWTFIAFVSWAFYPAALLATWLWMLRIAGARAAFLAVVLLSGPPAFFFNQAAHTANAGVLVVAPLALLALEANRFLACAVLNLIAIALHPIGLFLPPALAVNALLRRKRLVPGLLAASIPVLLYAPWLAHMWANRALVAGSRTSGAIELTGPGVNLGLFLLAAALLGIPALFRRRGSALGVIGPVAGFAVALPMGFGGRFLMFNVHWPLAFLGGLGLAELLRRLEGRALLAPLVRAAPAAIAIAALVAYPSLDIRLGPPRGGGGARRPDPPPEMGPGWRIDISAAALPRILDAGDRGIPGPGPGPGPGGPGAGGMDMAHRPGIEGFLRAISEHSAPGDILFVPDPPLGALITGATGRWTSSGMLREVRSPEPQPRPEACDLAALPSGGGPGGPPGGEARRRQDGARPRPGGPVRPDGRLDRGGLPDRPGRPPDGPPGFAKVFENELGSLWKNPAKPDHIREPAKAVIGLPLLLGLAAIAALLVAIDLLPRPRPRLRAAAALAGSIAAAACLLPLAIAAFGELRDPPGPPPLDPREPPPGVLEEIRGKHEAVLEAVRERIERGDNPDGFWPPGSEDRLRGFMEEGKFPEAAKFLDGAIEAAGGPDGRHGPGR